MEEREIEIEPTSEIETAAEIETPAVTQTGTAIETEAKTAEAGPERKKRKTRIGKVVSDKADKSIVVLVETMSNHPVYKKRVKKSKRFMAHDENNECVVGDTVRIMETRPLSATKRWRLVEVVEKAK